MQFQKLIFFSILCLLTLNLNAQSDLFSKAKKAAKEITSGNGNVSLSNDEVVAGLKEALTIGAENSAGLASKVDGFYKNPAIFIPWPQEARNMKEKLVAIGMSKQVEDFEASLNRAAEEAAKSAAPIFVSAVKNMTVKDGFNILKGADTSATNYLRTNTSESLRNTFTPIVRSAIDKVKVTSYWTPLITSYNKIPFVQKQNPDLEAYVTNKAIDGLMVLIAKEEINIRNNAAAQVTDLLKKVFGKK